MTAFHQRQKYLRYIHHLVLQILHNYILYAFLFYLFYHKLTINHHFFDIFLFPHCKTASEHFVIQRDTNKSNIHPCLTVLPFGILLIYVIYLDADLPIPSQ